MYGHFALYIHYYHLELDTVESQFFTPSVFLTSWFLAGTMARFPWIYFSQTVIFCKSRVISYQFRFFELPIFQTNFCFPRGLEKLLLGFPCIMFLFCHSELTCDFVLVGWTEALFTLLHIVKMVCSHVPENIAVFVYWLFILPKVEKITSLNASSRLVFHPFT